MQSWRARRNDATLCLHTRHTLFIPSYRYDYVRLQLKFEEVKRFLTIAERFVIASAAKQSQPLQWDFFNGPEMIYFFFAFGFGTSGTFFLGNHFANSFLAAAYLGSFARFVHSRASLSWS